MNAEKIAALRPSDVAIKNVLNKKIMTILARSTIPNNPVQTKLSIEAIQTQIKPEKYD